MQIMKVCLIDHYCRSGFGLGLGIRLGLGIKLGLCGRQDHVNIHYGPSRIFSRYTTRTGTPAALATQGPKREELNKVP